MKLENVVLIPLPSPAMATGGTDRLWNVEDLVAFSEAYE
jgi:hypothetical protein